MDSAKVSNSRPLHLAMSSVLKFVSKRRAKAISKNVAMPPAIEANFKLRNGMSVLVYFTNASQLPQADNSLGHNPNRSATADKNPALSAIRKNHSANFRCAIVKSIKDFMPSSSASVNLADDEEGSLPSQQTHKGRQCPLIPSVETCCWVLRQILNRQKIFAIRFFRAVLR
jgi:hypothetical protein